MAYSGFGLSDFRIQLALGLLGFEWSGRIPPEGFTIGDLLYVVMLPSLCIELGSTNIESEIDARNRARLEKMSPEEIANAQAEIMKNMDPALKKILQE
ncbi:transcriptional elongation regulator MINIYO [Tanacetum coccineum]